MQNPKYSSNTDDSGLPREEKLFHLLEELYGGIPEAEETLSAIRRGEVDGFLVSTDEGEKIYTLKTAEHPYRVLIEQMWEGAAILSTDGTILYSNESFARLLAMPLERVIGESIYTFIAPAGAANFRRMLEAKRSSGSAGENALQAHGKKEVPVHLSLKLLPMDGTQVFSLVATNLTERKQTEETLQRAYDKLGEHQAELITQNEELQEAHEALMVSEERYRDLYEFAPLGYFTLDARGEILEANLTGASLLGSERSRLIGARLQFFLEPRSLPALNDFLARAIGSETNETCDILLMREAGEPAWALLEGKSVGDRDSPRIRVAVTDISRQVREAERALRESEERFRLLTENASDIVVVLDVGGHILYASPSVRQVGGYALEALIGRSVVELIHPKDLPLATDALSRVAAYPKERVTLEIRLRHSSGEWLHFEIIGVNLLDEPAVRGLW